MAEHSVAENTVREAEWGHWGITFLTRVPGAYAPSSILGTLPFPVGTQGPQDGFMGSPERQRYVDAVAAWRLHGIVPEHLNTEHAFGDWRA